MIVKLDTNAIGRGSRAYLCGPALLAAALGAIPSVQAEGIEEVIVTAQRRDENVQSVPIAITSISSARLSAGGLETTEDLPHLTSGLSTSKGLGAGNYFFPYIRGVGSAITSAGIEPSVATYIDGVYQGDKQGNLVDLENLERVEVLKGPQGTLFGRNATGGAINITTKTPTDTFAAHGSLSYGSYDEKVERAFVNGPLAPGLSGNLSIVARQGGDYFYNIPTRQDFGGTTSITENGKLNFQPENDRFQVTLSLLYAKRRTTDVGANVVPTADSVPTLIFGGAPVGVTSYQPHKSNLNNVPLASSEAKDAGLTARYSFNSVDLISITSYQDHTHYNLLDYDLTNIPYFAFENSTKTKTWTQELQLVSTTDDPLQWMVGAYFIKMEDGMQPLSYVYAGPGGTPVHLRSWANTEGEALFTQATYEITPSTRLTGGLRYSVEQKTLTGETTLPALGDLVVAGPIDLSKDYSKLSWRLSVDHDFSQNVLGYVSYNRGYKSGGFDSTLIADQEAVSPEQLDAYEVGVKSLMLDHTLQINGAAYYYNYKDIQIQRVELTHNVLQSAGAATLYGLDLDVTYRPISNLQINVGLSWEHSEYTKFENASGVELNPDGSITSPFIIPSLKGEQLLNAPDFTGNLGVTYTWNFGQGHAIDFNPSYSYTSEYKQLPGNIARVDAGGTLNAALTWRLPGDHWYAGVWGKNLTDRQDVGAYASAFGASEQNVRPRTVGVTVGAKM